MHLTQKEVTCRNCGNKQNYNIYDGKFPTTESAVDVCKSCGFKSIWFDEDLKMNDQFMELVNQLNEEYKEELVDTFVIPTIKSASGADEKLIDDLVARKKVDTKPQKVYTEAQALDLVIDKIWERGLYITSSPMFMLTDEEIKQSLK